MLTLPQHSVAGNDIGSIAGHEQEFDAGIPGQQIVGQVTAVHPGHDHISQQQIDAVGVFPGQVDGLLRRSSRQHGVPLKFEHDLRHFQDRRFIFHQQYGFVAAGRGHNRILNRQKFTWGCTLRQVDLEGRSLSWLTVHGNEAVILLNRAVHRGQPETGALALLLGGEERLEQMADGLPVHAAAVVTDRQQHILAGHYPGVHSTP